MYGYKLPAMSMVEFSKFIFNLKRDLEEIRNKELSRILGRITTRMIDNMIVFGKDDFIKWCFRKPGESMRLARSRLESHSPLHHVFMSLKEDYWKGRKKGERNVFDFDFQLVINPIEPEIIHVKTNQKQLLTHWEKLPMIQKVNKSFSNGITINVLEGWPSHPFLILHEDEMLKAVPDLSTRIEYLMEAVKYFSIETEIQKDQLKELIPEIKKEHFYLSVNEIFVNSQAG